MSEVKTLDRLYLNPVNIAADPSHTLIDVRCLSCSKKDVCQFQDDYRKTATLIQNILGAPQEDREIVLNDDGFTGFNFKDNSIFPQEVNIVPKKEGQELKGDFLTAKFSSEDKVKMLYRIEDFYVMFIFNWSNEFEKFETSIGEELYYGIQYELKAESIESIQEVLANWRSELEENKRADVDIINTTLFSVILNCSAYEKIKSLGIRGTFDNLNEDYLHVATYHCEPNKIKPYDAPAQQVIPVYPVPIPKGPCKKPSRPPRRRDDC